MSKNTEIAKTVALPVPDKMYKEFEHWRIDFDGFEKGRLVSRFLHWFFALQPKDLLKAYCNHYDHTDCLKFSGALIKVSLSDDEAIRLHEISIKTGYEQNKLLFTGLADFLEKNGVYDHACALLRVGNESWNKIKKQEKLKKKAQTPCL
jgi:hypothetical protein